MASEQTQCRAYLYTEASGVVYELEDTETQLGRADHNDIVVTQSKSVSGVHARLTIQADHATLTDLNSLNGCVVNGVRIHNSSAQLFSGSTFRLGYDSEEYQFYFPQDVPPELFAAEPAADAVEPVSGAYEHQPQLSATDSGLSRPNSVPLPSASVSPPRPKGPGHARRATVALGSDDEYYASHNSEARVGRAKTKAAASMTGGHSRSRSLSASRKRSELQSRGVRDALNFGHHATTGVTGTVGTAREQASPRPRGASAAVATAEESASDISQGIIVAPQTRYGSNTAGTATVRSSMPPAGLSSRRDSDSSSDQHMFASFRPALFGGIGHRSAASGNAAPAPHTSPRSARPSLNHGVANGHGTQTAIPELLLSSRRSGHPASTTESDMLTSSRPLTSPGGPATIRLVQAHTGRGTARPQHLSARHPSQTISGTGSGGANSNRSVTSPERKPWSAFVPLGDGPGSSQLADAVARRKKTQGKDAMVSSATALASMPAEEHVRASVTTPLLAPSDSAQQAAGDTEQTRSQAADAAVSGNNADAVRPSVDVSESFGQPRPSEPVAAPTTSREEPEALQVHSHTGAATDVALSASHLGPASPQGQLLHVSVGPRPVTASRTLDRSQFITQPPALHNAEPTSDDTEAGSAAFEPSGRVQYSADAAATRPFAAASVGPDAQSKDSHVNITASVPAPIQMPSHTAREASTGSSSSEQSSQSASTTQTGTTTEHASRTEAGPASGSPATSGARDDDVTVAMSMSSPSAPLATAAAGGVETATLPGGEEVLKESRRRGSTLKIRKAAALALVAVGNSIAYRMNEVDKQRNRRQRAERERAIVAALFNQWRAASVIKLESLHNVDTTGGYQDASGGRHYTKSTVYMHPEPAAPLWPIALARQQRPNLHSELQRARLPGTDLRNRLPEGPIPLANEIAAGRIRR